MAVKSMSDQLGDSKRAIRTLATALEDVRMRRLRAIDDRQAIERAPVSKDEAYDRLEAFTARLRATAFSRVSAARFAAPNYQEPIVSDMLDLVLGVAAGMIGEQIGEKLGEIYAAADGYSVAERARNLTVADNRIFALELEEEAFIRAAERAGADFLRRSDAHPMAVLAAEEMLP